MELRPAFQLKTVIKALTDVVLPAVDANNKLAQEQARLVIGMLQLVALRQPLMYRYERDELARFLALAASLQDETRAQPVAAQASRALAEVVTIGTDVLARARAEPAELESANFALREKIGALVTASCADDPGNDNSARLKAIGAKVTAHAKAQLLRERSWLLMQGWEADPQALPTIEALIGDGPPAP